MLFKQKLNHLDIPAAVNIDKCGDLAISRVLLVDLVYGGKVGCVASHLKAMELLVVATRSFKDRQLDLRPNSLAADTCVLFPNHGSVC